MEQPTVTTHPTVVVVECVSVTWLVRDEGGHEVESNGKEKR